MFGVTAKNMNVRRRQLARERNRNRKAIEKDREVVVMLVWKGRMIFQKSDDFSEEQFLVPLAPAPITQEQLTILQWQREARCPLADDRYYDDRKWMVA